MCVYGVRVCVYGSVDVRVVSRIIYSYDTGSYLSHLCRPRPSNRLDMSFSVYMGRMSYTRTEFRHVNHEDKCRLENMVVKFSFTVDQTLTN